MTNQGLEQEYIKARKQVREGRIPVLVSVYRWGPEFQYAVGTELCPKGIYRSSYNNLSQIHRTIEQKVSESLEYDQNLKYYDDGEKEAYKHPGVIGYNMAERVRRARGAYFREIVALFPNVNEDIRAFVPQELRTGKNWLEIVSEICCREKPSIFKKCIGTITNKKDYDRDNWGKESIVVARFCKTEPFYL
ncbi:MAG: hypothetical protein WCV90_08495 [Candidatus Woesearchaeota archaeon]